MLPCVKSSLDSTLNDRGHYKDVVWAVLFLVMVAATAGFCTYYFKVPMLLHRNVTPACEREFLPGN